MKPRKIIKGSCVATIYKSEENSNYRVVYNDEGHQVTKGVFSWGVKFTEKQALRKAEARANEVVETLSHRFSPKDVNSKYSYMLDLIKKYNLSVEDLLHVVSSKQQVNETSISDAALSYLNFKKGVEKRGHSYIKERKQLLLIISKAFINRKISTITAKELQAVFDNQEAWGDGRKRKMMNNYGTFERWCVKKNYLAKPQFNYLDLPVISKTKEHDVYSPDELRILIANVLPEYLVWVLLQAFLGLRVSEVFGKEDVNGVNRSTAIKWGDMHLNNEKPVVHLKAYTTKGYRMRIITCSPAFVEWIKPIWVGKNPDAPCVPANIPEPRLGLKGVPETIRLGAFVGGWKRNALRASRATYRYAQTDYNSDLVSREMGHSKEILEQVYLNADESFLEIAKDWFSIYPKDIKRKYLDEINAL